MSPFPAQRGITTSQLIVSLALTLIVAILLVSARKHFFQQAHIATYLENGRILYLAMRHYASDSVNAGAFPTFADSKAKTGLFTTSNDAFSSLLPRYLDDDKIFFNKTSAWCYKPPRAQGFLLGKNDWCYLRGLTERSDARWPLLANAFVPGSAHYVSDERKPGGVWKGKNAIVLWVSGSAEWVDTALQGDHFFVKRPDKPSANAFEKDGDWLAGEDVQLLYPATP